MTILEFHEIILKKVSFNDALFIKEFGKEMKHISSNEKPILLEWCKKEFRDKYEQLVADYLKVSNNYLAQKQRNNILEL